LLDLQPKGPSRRTVQNGYRIEFPLRDFHRHIHDFAFLLGNQQRHVEGQDPIDLGATPTDGTAGALERKPRKKAGQKREKPVFASMSQLSFLCLFFASSSCCILSL
jgi:hypothetical protein